MPADSVKLHCTVVQEVDVPTYGTRLMLVSVGTDTLRIWTARSKVEWMCCLLHGFRALTPSWTQVDHSSQ
jgi:hypothetical protein